MRSVYSSVNTRLHSKLPQQVFPTHEMPRSTCSRLAQIVSFSFFLSSTRLLFSCSRLRRLENIASSPNSERKVIKSNGCTLSCNTAHPAVDVRDSQTSPSAVQARARALKMSLCEAPNFS